MAKQQLYSFPGTHFATAYTPGTASSDTATVTLGVWRAPVTCNIESIEVQFEGAMTGRATNFRTFSFIDGSDDGSGTDVIAAVTANAATVTTSTLTPLDMSPATPYALDEGDILQFSNALTGNGLAVPVPCGTVTIGFRPV